MPTRTPLSALSIKGYKSIRELPKLQLGSLTVLLGANGAGKSNFVDFFRLLRAMRGEALQAFVTDGGGAQSYPFRGPSDSDGLISAELAFGENRYRFSLKPNVAGDMIIESEDVIWDRGGDWHTHKGPRKESLLKSWCGKSGLFGKHGPEHYVQEAISSWVVYHVHDTSIRAGLRQDHSARDFRELSPNSDNIAPFLHNLRLNHASRYERIRNHVRDIAPYFDDFLLEPRTKGPNELLRLEWTQRGVPKNTPFQPWQFSDGTIRFICLATALLQPDPPSTIVIDEPELGLHPAALSLLASLIREAAEATQVIVSTQSTILLDYFQPEEILVVTNKGGQSVFERLDKTAMQSWLDEYGSSLGELMRTNVIDASPSHE